MRSLLLAVKLIVWLLWPTTVYAAGIALGDTFREVPLFAWLVVVIVSTLSGLAALLNRIKNDIPPRLGLFVSAHMVSSLLAGVLAFFIGEQAGLSGMAEAVSIAVSAYAGAALIDSWAAKLIEKAKL